MQTAKKDDYYKSGFAKELRRSKHNLPINERLKKARNAKGLTLAQVIVELEQRGEKLGLSTLQGYEANETSLNHRYPSITALLALASLYECSTDYIFGLSNMLSPIYKKDLKTRFEYEDISWEEKPISARKRQMMIYALNTIMEHE
jgi:transcriptional regulator with XRE-family HTH domain